MEFDFLEPVNDGILKFISSLSSQELGSKIVLHTQDQFPDISKITYCNHWCFRRSPK